MYQNKQFGAIVLLLLVAFAVSSGCMGINSTGDLQNAVLNALAPYFVFKGTPQYDAQLAAENPTIIPTVTPTLIPISPTPLPTPTVAARTVNPSQPGERWEKQWYRTIIMKNPNPLFNASLKKPLDFGIVVYDHRFMSSYTWWSDQDGQYYKAFPKPGYKFLFVWVHEEVFGDSKTNIVSFEAFNVKSFLAQHKSTMYYNDTDYNPVNNILEFDTKPDYYHISRTSAFGYTRRYVGKVSQYGGWIAEQDVDLYTGQGNSWDGYIIYQVPAQATDSDTLLIGNFGGYGNAYWRFDIYAGN